MSKLNGMQIFELMSDMDDSLIAESAASVAFLASTAVGTAAVAGTMSTTAAAPAKAGFGAWLAKGGWVALAAGAVAAAGVAVGAFLLGNSEEKPPVGEDPATVETHDKSEGKGESETEAPTVEDTTEESTAEPADPRYFQFPLTGATDTTSYVSLPDMTAEGEKAVEFFVLPTDTDAPELTSALKYTVTNDFPMNILLVSTKEKENGSYGILCLMEKAQPDTSDMLAGDGFVGLECCRFSFDGTAENNYYIRHHSPNDPDYGNYRFTYYEGQKVSPGQHKQNLLYLKRAEEFIEMYSDPERYEYTVLYSYIDGTEVINTPSETFPEFPFTIFNTFNEPDLEG